MLDVVISILHKTRENYLGVDLQGSLFVTVKIKFKNSEVTHPQINISKGRFSLPRFFGPNQGVTSHSYSPGSVFATIVQNCVDLLKRRL